MTTMLVENAINKTHELYFSACSSFLVGSTNATIVRVIPTVEENKWVHLVLNYKGINEGIKVFQRWRSCSWPVEHINVHQISRRRQTCYWKEGNQQRHLLQLSRTRRTCLLQPKVDGDGSGNNL